MRKLLVSNMITADGFFAGPNGELDWHNVDAEFNDYATDLLTSVDTLVFGRVTYQMMAAYWPTPEGTADDPTVADHMNRLAKLVISRTLRAADWHNTRIVDGDVAAAFSDLKQQSGKDLVIFGSGTVVTALTQLGLIDEYRLIVNPVLLGRGKSLFAGLSDQLNLRLTNVRPFRSGNVLLCYEPRA